MSDNLVIGGATFTGVTGIKATDTSDNVVTFESGGGGGIETGIFTVASRIALSDAGNIVPVGFSGHPDMIVCWLDYDEFISLSSYPKSTWYRFALIKTDTSLVSSSPLIRYSGSMDVQSISGQYLRLASPNIFTTTDSNNPCGNSIGPMSYYTGNAGKSEIKNDGTVKVARHNQGAAAYIPAGTFHWIALTGGDFLI